MHHLFFSYTALCNAMCILQGAYKNDISNSAHSTLCGLKSYTSYTMCGTFSVLCNALQLLLKCKSGYIIMYNRKILQWLLHSPRQQDYINAMYYNCITGADVFVRFVWKKSCFLIPGLHCITYSRFQYVSVYCIHPNVFILTESKFPWSMTYRWIR